MIVRSQKSIGFAARIVNCTKVHSAVLHITVRHLGLRCGRDCHGSHKCKCLQFRVRTDRNPRLRDFLKKSTPVGRNGSDRNGGRAGPHMGIATLRAAAKIG